MDSIAGKVKNVSRLKNGTLLVGDSNERQASVYLKPVSSDPSPYKLEDMYFWIPPPLLLLWILWMG
jgi:hypothetical protein